MTDVAKGLTTSGEYKFDRGTSFNEATTVQKGDNESEYVAEIPPDWCFGPVAHGGYLAGLLSRAVSQHVQFLATQTQRQVPDTLGSCNITYIAPVLPGRADVRIESKSLSRSSGYFVASLYQTAVDPKSGKRSKPSLRAEASVSMTTEASMNKTTLSKSMETRRRIATTDLYTRHKDGHHAPHEDSGMSFYKFKQGWECYFNPASADRAKYLNKHAEHGPPVFDVWWKLDHNITTHELAFLADLVGPVLFNYEDVRATHWLSTRQMGFDVVRVPEKGQSGWKWVFCRMELIENAGDRFYCDVTMADEDGNVIGVARQNCIVRPFELVGKSKGRKSDQKDAKAKI